MISISRYFEIWVNLTRADDTNYFNRLSGRIGRIWLFRGVPGGRLALGHRDYVLLDLLPCLSDSGDPQLPGRLYQQLVAGLDAGRGSGGLRERTSGVLLGGLGEGCCRGNWRRG